MTDINQISSLIDTSITQPAQSNSVASAGTTPKHFPKIGFLGGAAWQPTDQPYLDAYETARLLAEKGYRIVNGGGPGVMEATTKGAHAGGGKALAITYHPGKPKRHYEGTTSGNDADEEVYTLDYFDRTKTLLQNTDIHIIFRGSLGTLSEFGMTWISSWIHDPNNKPIVLFGDFWNEILDVIEKHMTIVIGERDLLKICNTPQEVVDYLTNLEDYFVVKPPTA